MPPLPPPKGPHLPGQGGEAAPPPGDAALSDPDAPRLRLLPDDRLAGAGFDGRWPVLLLPVRLETRWMPAGGGLELRVRLFPDVLHVASERTALQADEALLARSFLDAADEDARRAAWDELVRLRGPGPAAQAVLRVRAGEAGVPGDVDTLTRAHLLPTRFVLLLDGGARTQVAWGADLPAELPAGVADPQDEATRWQFDFDAAERVGLALRVPFDAGTAPDVTRVIALGLRDGAPDTQGVAWAGHLRRQFGSAGAELLAPGTPTNNTEDAPSGFDSRSRADAQRAALASLDKPLAPTCDGARLARALGMEEGAWRPWAGARANGDDEVHAMHEALWPGTLGTWLKRLMLPALSAPALAFMRGLFIEDVRSRGPWPSLRVGRQPYGLLPATSLQRWHAADETGQAAVVLRVLREHWSAQARPPTLHAGGDEAALRAALAQLPVSRRVAVRRYMDLPDAMRIPTPPDAVALLRRLGVDTLPPLGAGYHWGMAQWSSLPDVADPRADRAKLLSSNYLASLGALLDAQALRNHAALAGGPSTLLYVLARAGLLEQALDLAKALFNVVLDPTDPLGVPIERPWRALSQASPRLDGKSISEVMTFHPGLTEMTARLGNNPVPEWVDLVRPLTLQRNALARLAKVPVGALARLLHETLDVAGHRLDAWVTALATRRLYELRRQQPAGLHLGAWGWASVPAVPRQPGAPARSDGFELAPTLAHACTAAVLRSGCINHRRDGVSAGMAVDLGSQRMRQAQELLHLARAGQGLGELLGRRLESWLIDHGLGTATPVLRAQARLPGQRLGIDGLRLAEVWRERAPPAALAQAAAQLQEWVDALGDLMLAESVHCTVSGQPERARAAIEAIERGEVLCDQLEVLRGPQDQRRTAWQLAVALPDGPSPWPVGAAGVRGIAVPRLEAWAAAWLGASDALQWSASGTRGDGSDATLVLTPADLGLGALDLVVLSRRSGGLVPLVRAAAGRGGLSHVEGVQESRALQAALLAARLLGRMLDGAAHGDDGTAAAQRAAAALAALRADDDTAALRRAAWYGLAVDATAVDECLARSEGTEGAARLEVLVGLHCTGSAATDWPVALPDVNAALGAPSPAAWLHDLGRVRPTVAALAAAGLAANAGRAGPWSVRERPDGGRLVLVGAPAAATQGALLVLDHWTEPARSDHVTAALAVHADAPRARAPQSLLLAVSPTPEQAWTLSTLADVVEETLAMLPLRLVQPSAVAGLYLPALYVAEDMEVDGKGGLAAS